VVQVVLLEHQLLLPVLLLVQEQAPLLVQVLVLVQVLPLRQLLYQ
jgi:hypothetical protein